MPPVRYVSATNLRQRFNRGEYFERVQAGELRVRIKRNGHPSTEISGESFCTRSQFVSYFDRTDVRVALVHQYLRVDGTLGGAGRPDPKEIVEEGVIYSLERSTAD